METVWTIIITSIASIITGIGSWFLSRSKYKAEVETTKISNFDASIDAYKKMYEDMLGDLRTEKSDLQAENQKLQAEKEDLKKEIAELKAELVEQRGQIMTLTNFVLASTLQKSGVAVPDAAVESLKNIIK